MKRSGDPWLIDGAIVGLALLGLAVVVRLIVSPVALASSAPSITVAVVVESANEVRRRPAGGFEWRPLESGDALAAGELVFVGPSSYVRLSIGNDTVISIEENSLVRMPDVKATTEADPELQLVKGSVDVQSQTRSVTVARGKTQVKLGNDSRARLTTAGQGAEVELKRGGASVEIQGGGLGDALEAGTRTTLNEQGTKTNVERLSVKQLSPNDGDRFFATDADPRATFAWSSATNDCELVLKGREARRVRASSTSLSIVLEPGFYSWRVDCEVRKDNGKGNASSETRWLVVHSRKAPRLLAPRDGAVVDLSHAKELAISWTRAPGATRYSVNLVSDEPGFPADPQTSESPRPRARLALPSREGRYCATLRAEYDEGPGSPWSPRECFRVVTQPVLKAPQLYVPKREKVDEAPKKKDKGAFLWQLIGGVAYAAAEQESAITLRWEAIIGARAYMLEIAEDRAFARVVLKQRAEKNYFRWFKIARRNYYWRVRGVDEMEREGVVSDTKLIGVETEPPVPLSPTRKQVVYSDSAASEVELKWSAADALQSFNVIVARDSDMQQPIVRVEVKGKRSVSVKLPHFGEYYWRVTGVDLEGQATQASSSAGFVLVAGSPDLLQPKNQERFASNEVDLKWAKRLVAGYEVELTGGPDGGSERLNVSGTQVTMRPGNGSWTWRVRGKKPETPWSERRTFWIDEANAVEKPASTPMASSGPSIVRVDPKRPPPPAPPKGGVRVMLGARVGFFSNFGAVASVRPGLDLSVRFALGPGELGGFLSADYYPASSRFIDQATGLSVQSDLHAVSTSLGGMYALRLGRFRPYAVAGAQVVPITVRTQLGGIPVASGTLISIGGFVTPGCELAFGPGAAFLEIMLALSSRARTPQFEVDGSGVFVAIGYRFSLRSSGRLRQ